MAKKRIFHLEVPKPLSDGVVKAHSLLISTSDLPPAITEINAYRRLNQTFIVWPEQNNGCILYSDAYPGGFPLGKALNSEFNIFQNGNSVAIVEQGALHLYTCCGSPFFFQELESDFWKQGKYVMVSTQETLKEENLEDFCDVYRIDGCEHIALPQNNGEWLIMELLAHQGEIVAILQIRDVPEIYNDTADGSRTWYDYNPDTGCYFIPQETAASN